MSDPQRLEHALAAVRAGNREAFRDVIRETVGLLRPLVYAYVHDDAATSDVLQDVYVKIYQQVGRYQPGTNCVAWIKTVARYEALSARQAHVRERRRLDRYRVEVQDRLGAAVDGQDREQPLEDRLRALPGCLQQLTARARQLVELHYFHGQAVTLVAATVGMSATAVSVTLHRARHLLARCLARTGAPA